MVMKTIASYKALFDYALELLVNDAAPEPLDLQDSLNFDLIVCGKSWGNFIDYRGAQYIVQMQKAVNKTFSEAYLVDTEEELKFLKEKTIIKTRLKEGSSIFQVDIVEALKVLFANMTDPQPFWFSTIAVLTIAGCYSLKKHLEIKKHTLSTNLEIEKLNTAVKQKIISLFEKACDIIIDRERPIRTLINKLDEQDTLLFSHETKPLSLKELRERYPRQQRLQTKTDYIDDTFAVRDIRYEDDGVFVMLEKGALKFKALAALNTAEIENLYAKIKEKHAAGEVPFELDLQVTAQYTPREIKAAAIIGTGAKRPQAVSILDIFAAA